MMRGPDGAGSAGEQTGLLPVQRRESLRGFLSAVLLAAVALVAIALMAAISVRSATAPWPSAATGLSPLPSPAATAAATAGWWTSFSMTPPAAGALPGLPTVALSARAGARAGTPVSFRIRSCPRADVKIEEILSAERRTWWNIYGTANIANLWYWKGEISAGPEPFGLDGQGWQMLYRSERPAQGDLLIEFNTRTVPPGTYRVRLTAVDRTGNYPEPCLIEVTTA
jgi:hypothetical protein